MKGAEDLDRIQLDRTVRNRRRIGWWLVLLFGAPLLFVCYRISKSWLTESTSPAQASSSSELPFEESPSNLRVGETPHPLDPVLSLAKELLLEHRQRHASYTATVRKRERVGSKLSPESRMSLKLRYREVESFPSARQIDVYLKFLEPKGQAGREVIWREGENDNLMVVHESGLLNVTRVQLAPNSRLAMLGNRYPLSDIGIEKLLLKLIARGTRDRGMGDCEVRLIDSINVENRECQRIEVCHPERAVLVDGEEREHEYYKAIIDIDREHRVPIRYASYLWPDSNGGDAPIDEEFAYEDLVLNPTIEDIDFNPDNPAYNYP